MQGKKSFQYRIQANSQIINRAEHWLSLCRDLYNTALNQRIVFWNSRHRPISCYEQMKQLPNLKAEIAEYSQVGSQVLQDVLKRLDKAYQGFFRRVKNGDKPGFPRFKGKDRYESFTLKQWGWSLEGKYLFIRNIGKFKLRLSRPIESDIKTVTIRRRPTGKWFVIFSCDNVPSKPLPKTNKTIGIDVGCQFFLTKSDGGTVENPRFFKKSQDILAKRQQSLSRRAKDSNRRNKARILVAKAHEKIRNQRRDFHFKIANKLVKSYDTIFIEKMTSWNSWRSLNRSMRDVAWFEFFDILRFKAEEAGREVVKVPSKGTSQTCSECGAQLPDDLSIRVHSCPSCGLSIDRHFNAALNILRAGQALRDIPCTIPEIP